MTALPRVREIRFGQYVLESENARLLRRGMPVQITPKALDVLQFLVARPNRLVTKVELLSAIWPDVLVSDASVKVCVGEIRKVLDDSASAPTYIETVHRRGYRFIAEVRENVIPAPDAPVPLTGSGAAGAEATAQHGAPAAAPHAPARPAFVGRDRQMRQLDEMFELARAGRRQCMLVSGGAGRGKTALVEAFTRGLTDRHPSAPTAVIAYGHCFEQFGAGEPYMPVWEAIGRVPARLLPPQLSSLLARHSASYAVEPAPAAGASSPPMAPAGRSDLMLRELAEAVEALAANVPVVLVLEDVQWADSCTIDLISALARRGAPSRLMIVATYRPDELFIAGLEHPSRLAFRGLAAAGRCTEITLDFLEEPAVGEYLTARFPGGDFPVDFAHRLYQRTEGCPLFLVHLVNDLIDQGVLSDEGGTWHVTGGSSSTGADEVDTPVWLAVLETQIPATVRALVEGQVERLDAAARSILEAAAVAGVEFSAAAMAAAAGMDVVEAERACDGLARRYRFLEECGNDEWPDGTVATRYRFAHELYQGVVYEQVPIGRRATLHRQVGARLEAAWGPRAAEEAATLAMHFEAGRDWPRAVLYTRAAAQAAGRQYAHRESVDYLRRALAAVARLEPAERERHELDVLCALGVNLQVTRGFAAPDVESVHARAHALCVARNADGRGDVAGTFPVLWGIWLFHKVRSELAKASEMGRELLALAGADGSRLLQAHQAMCVTHLCLGDPRTTCHHMERAAAIYDPVLHARNAEVFGQDPGAATLAFGAVALWQLGRSQDAIDASTRATALAEQLRQPSSRALTMYFAAMLHQFRGDARQAGWWAGSAVALAEEEGFSFWRAGGLVLRGWARAAQAGAARPSDADAGIDDIRRGIEAWLATGSRTYHTYHLGLLADALYRAGRADEARRPLDEALAATRSLSEGLYEAELHRLKGRVILRTSHPPFPDAVRASFIKALSVARAQGAAAFEERAAADLTKLGGGESRWTDIDAAQSLPAPPNSHDTELLVRPAAAS